MKKIYVENSEFKESLENIGLSVYNELYVDDDELDNIMNKIIGKMLNNQIVKDLNNIGIHIDITYQLDSTIYNE